MKTNNKELGKSFEQLEAMVYNTVAKINEFKKINRDLKSKINELKRIQALNEKKTERLKQELDNFKLNDKQSWQKKEKDIKLRLKNLSERLIAFERSYTLDR